MIDLTQAYKDALFGPLKYLIQISEDNGVSWVTLPMGAEVVSPLGSLTGETEIEPFQFVGSDIEITAFNENGYWTNSSKTGKLDTGLAIKFRIKTAPQAIADEWVQLIEGYVDLSTVTNYRTGYTVCFTVRGTLNVLDSVLANYVLADRPATYPWKFGGWLQVVSVDGAHPEGLFELKLDASEAKISWDNGIGKSINTDSDIVLTGQNYNVITVRNLRGTQAATSLAQTSGTISQWVAIKSVDSVKGYYQPFVSLPMDRLKALIYDYVDLDYSGVESFPIKRPDPNIINYVPERLFGSTTFTHLEPVCVVGLDNNRWLISFDNPGTTGITGAYVLTITETPYFKVQSLAAFDPAHLTGVGPIVNAYRTTTYLYLLGEATGENHHRYLNTISSGWKIYKYNLATGAYIGVYGGVGALLWKSFAGFADDDFYGAIITTGILAKTNRIQISGASLAFTVKSLSAYQVGVSMCPGVVSLRQVYICATGYIDSTDNKVKVYLQIYDTVNNINYSVLTEIASDYDQVYSFYNLGPVSMAKRNVVAENNGIFLETFGLYIMLGPITYTAGTKTKQLNSDKAELHGVLIDEYTGYLYIIYGIAKNYSGNYFNCISTGQTGYVFMDDLPDWQSATIVGRSIVFTSATNGAIVGVVKTITAFERIEYMTDRFCSKITFDTALPATLSAGDAFKVYTAGFSLTSARYEYDKIDDDIQFIKEGPMVGTFTTIPQSTGFLAGVDFVKAFGDKELLFKNVPGGYPLAGDYNADGTRILIVTQDNIQVVDLNQADGIDTTPEQYPEVALADFGDKTLRDAIQEVAISANCFLMPSEHNKKLSLIYRGKTITPVFTLLNTEYKEGPRATPYYDYDAIELNDKKAGVFYAGNKQRDLSLTTQTTPDAYSQSLANDILDHIGSGDRTHEIVVSGRLELEPGDEGYLELKNGTQVTGRILGISTDPLTLDRSMTVREIPNASH